MSNVFSCKKIVDRTNETSYIIENVNKIQDINKVLFIWSDSGFGKTSIVEKASQSKELNIPIIIVDTPPTNNNKLIENGEFLSYIAEEISSFFKENGWSLKNFIALGMSDKCRKKETIKMFEKFTSIPTAVFSILCERLFLLNEFDDEYILKEHSTDNILIVSEYIKFMMTMFNFALDVSNVQNIDSMSLKQLNNILASTRGQCLIFEYTTKDNNTDELWQIAKSFEKFADIDIYEINKLPIEYALTIANPSNYNIISEIEEFYKNIAKGNLFKLYKIKNEIDQTSFCKMRDPVQHKIDCLTYQQKLILSIICIHDGCIKIELLEDIIFEVSKEYFITDSDVDGLCELIEKTNRNYRLQHASIMDCFEIGNENFASLVAYNFLEKYYLKKAEFENNSNDNIFFLLKIYSIFEPTKILGKLDEFKKLIVSCVSETQGNYLIDKIFSALASNVDTYVKLHIIHLGYQLGFYNCAYNLLMKICKNFECFHMMHCMLLNRTDRHDENISLCKKLLKNSTYNDRFYLIITMIKMLSERSLNNSRNYKRTFYKVFNKKKYMNIYEYGFLLRNSQIVLSYKESLQYIKRSIDFFLEKKSYKDAACSELTYAVQLARLGAIDEAKMHLSNVTDILLNSTFEKHIIYVNQSAISLLNGEADENVALILEQSLLTATTNFDKLAILNNKLCWFIKNKVNESLFKELKKQIDSHLAIEPDFRLHRRIYINYSNYYKHVLNNATLSCAWLKKASEIPSNNDELGDAYIKHKYKNKELEFLANQPYYVSFITYWHFDIPID